ncbi:MAG: AraC family transcriptional regulator, partial [Clostridia bacterium]
NRQNDMSNAIHGTVEKMLQFIASHLGEDLSLVRLAELSGLNASYLSRLFKKATGNTLINHITTLKMKRACELLCDQNTRMQTIGQQLGFPNSAYFSYFFKKNAGMTPSEYREEHCINLGEDSRKSIFKATPHK